MQVGANYTLLHFLCTIQYSVSVLHNSVYCLATEYCSLGLKANYIAKGVDEGKWSLTKAKWRETNQGSSLQFSERINSKR